MTSIAFRTAPGPTHPLDGCDTTAGYTTATLAARADLADAAGDPRAIEELLRAAYSAAIDGSACMADMVSQKDHDAAVKDLQEQVTDVEKERDEALAALGEAKAKNVTEALTEAREALSEARKERDAVKRALARTQATLDTLKGQHAALQERHDKAARQIMAWIGDDATAVATAAYWRERALAAERETMTIRDAVGKRDAREAIGLRIVGANDAREAAAPSVAPARKASPRGRGKRREGE